MQSKAIEEQQRFRKEMQDLRSKAKSVTSLSQGVAGIDAFFLTGADFERTQIVAAIFC